MTESFSQFENKPRYNFGLNEYSDRELREKGLDTNSFKKFEYFPNQASLIENTSKYQPKKYFKGYIHMDNLNWNQPKRF